MVMEGFGFFVLAGVYGTPQDTGPKNLFILACFLLELAGITSMSGSVKNWLHVMWVGFISQVRT